MMHHLELIVLFILATCRVVVGRTSKGECSPYQLRGYVCTVEYGNGLGTTTACEYCPKTCQGQGPCVAYRSVWASSLQVKCSCRGITPPTTSPTPRPSKLRPTRPTPTQLPTRIPTNSPTSAPTQPQVFDATRWTLSSYATRDDKNYYGWDCSSVCQRNGLLCDPLQAKLMCTKDNFNAVLMETNVRGYPAKNCTTWASPDLGAGQGGYPVISGNTCYLLNSCTIGVNFDYCWEGLTYPYGPHKYQKIYPPATNSRAVIGPGVTPASAVPYPAAARDVPGAYYQLCACNGRVKRY